MSVSSRSGPGRVAYALACVVILGAVIAPRTACAAPAAGFVSSNDSLLAAAARKSKLVPVDDSLRGRSGKLLMRLVTRARATLALPLFARFFGDSSIERPGLYSLPDSILAHPFTFIALRPFSDKQKGRVGSYRIGFWPSERGRLTTDAYENPDGFIEVTPENQGMQISEHFRLSDFLTHDQRDIWPKYLVLNEDLVDKLELVFAQLQRDGVRVNRMVIMSGFRTPWYNRHGGHVGGRAELSRHMYGDAADVYVDNGSGRMADLNHDGRVDSRDAKVILRAVEEVEHEHPELSGGVGVYRATRAHGPFAHIDVRGWRARWGRS
ncbi:MAG TPA: D-Ala-D-Ala carboxypeptidase family metallohydrolase [Gemmatimonadaceae bacterium]|jgi:uncharacterized protein YcbK (DUF882 family)